MRRVLDKTFYTTELVDKFDGCLFSHASNKALTAENLKAAITAMDTLTGDGGRPLGISPNLLVVPKALKFTAKRILEAELVNEGGVQVSNDVAGSLDLLIADWL